MGHYSLLALIFLILIALCKGQEEIETVSVDSDGRTHNEDRRLADLDSVPDELPPTALKYTQVPGPPPQQYWVEFINESDEVVELYYDNGRDGVLQGVLRPNEVIKIGTYQGHQFYYQHPGHSHEKLYWTTMKYGVNQLIFKTEEQRKLEEEKLKKEAAAFQKFYKEQKGIEWESFYPRPKPVLYMYPVTEIGQTFQVKTNYTHLKCYPQSFVNKKELKKCLIEKKPITLEWSVLSVKPKVLLLKNFLSPFECQHIIDLAQPLLRRSQVGAQAFEDLTRTSSTAWVKRSFTEAVDWIFRRIAHAINIDHFHLWDTIGAESLQVVRYQLKQYYRPHHDWRNNREQMRFLTFLIYLNNQVSNSSGGETHFPRIDLKVHPGQGSVVMFYNMLEDGNADTLTLHEAMPVLEGEKWLSNCWVWDPNFS
ncbi:prolyl 4-hydroxylase alpha subunit [Reticulomyxa filosa]|uniref:Prolyl 4-hydroxylase alpha subunit n=1 Tax=Reticulomyxa filosa TaxID=46433 RepID=X6M9E9_RETFI|nr:prolyl 4-hydroxylase alpha subunit [Reticulomyxa filosa]|eukprot:ETO10504.1 prolyl 4-hydroxylase alpha subunit [Reticulomyxa filosa]